MLIAERRKRDGKVLAEEGPVLEFSTVIHPEYVDVFSNGNRENRQNQRKNV